MSKFIIQSVASHSIAELYHAGVKGMKWGVRKAEKDKRIASKMLSKAAKESDKRARLYLRSSEKQRLKEHKTLAKKYKKIGEAYAKDSKKYNAYLSKIQANTVKAGKDYVVSSKWHMDINFPLGVGIARDRTLRTTSGLNINTKLGFY